MPLCLPDPGYSVCWDNVQKLSITRHHLRQENKMMLWALCFAAQNRISFRDLDAVDNTFSVTDIELQVKFFLFSLVLVFRELKYTSIY